MSRLAPTLALLLAACGSAPAEPPPEPVAEPAPAAAEPAAAEGDRGAVVFATYCASCHGPDGRGDGPAAAALKPPPVDLHGPRPEHLRGTPGGRRAVIENGSPGTAMVGWKEILSPEDLDAVYGFVHTLRHGPAGG